MTAWADAERLADYIIGLPNFEIRENNGAAYEHMGALTSDAILQAGLNYNNVVAPRIAFILREYYQFNTVSSFSFIFSELGSKRVLNWSHPEKPRRLRDLLSHLFSVQVETVSDLNAYLNAAGSRECLQEIKGIGPKTIDYLAGLSGIQTVAIDRHVMKALTRSGISNASYDSAKEVFLITCQILRVRAKDLDHSIWSYFARM